MNTMYIYASIRLHPLQSLLAFRRANIVPLGPCMVYEIHMTGDVQISLELCEGPGMLCRVPWEVPEWPWGPWGLWGLPEGPVGVSEVSLGVTAGTWGIPGGYMGVLGVSSASLGAIHLVSPGTSQGVTWMPRRPPCAL